MTTGNPSPMRWHCLQHVPFEGPAYLASWVKQRGYLLTSTELWRDTAFPSSDQYDGMFILGGPMNVYEDEKYPWLVPEKQFIARAILQGKPILGVCLGAQLLAVVLGGSVTENLDHEIGWFPVELTPAGRGSALLRDFPNEFMAFHWHGDRFSIPPQAIHVARSEGCQQQAFVYENHIVGLQFHLETTRDNIAALAEHCGEDLGCGPYIQDPYSIQDCAGYLPEAHRLLSKLLDNLATGSGAPDCADPAAMSLTELVDHIEREHHAYLRRELPRLNTMLQELAATQGPSDRRLHRVLDTFTTMANELCSHMLKEEQCLFPMIRELDASDQLPTFLCGSLANPIRQMEFEHEQADSALQQLRELTNDFVPSERASDIHRAALDALSHLDQDMHVHIEKEDNVLFPRTLEMVAQKSRKPAEGTSRRPH